MQRPDLTNIFTIRIGLEEKVQKKFPIFSQTIFWKGETESEQDS